MIAVSAIRAVVDYIKRLWYGTPTQARPFYRRAPNTPVGDSPVSTVLLQDPICGTYVAADTSLKKIIAGRVYYFCSAECRNKFTA